MPIKLGASLLLLSATLGMQIRFFETSMTQFLRFVEAMLRGVR
jgi:hypothetical protein